MAKKTEENIAAWEKTVEWAFVRNYLKNTEFAAPIDGDHEISDAILAQRGQWFIIEFKYTENDFDSETLKYPSLNRKRTSSVLRKNYSVDKVDIEKLEKIKPIEKWQAAVLDYEKKLMGQMDVEQFEKDSLLIKYRNALERLYTRYTPIHPKVNSDLEPHFFVFSKEEKFEKLWTLPYWMNWRKVLENPRGEAFDAEFIGVYGQNFAAFSDYVRELAIARGYNLEKLENGGQNDFKTVVFGKVSGFSRERAVTMTLDTFISYHDDLKAAYEIKMPEVQERKSKLSRSTGYGIPYSK